MIYVHILYALIKIKKNICDFSDTQICFILSCMLYYYCSFITVLIITRRT